MDIDRADLVPAGLAVLAVIALGVTAATLDSTVVPAGGSGGFGGDDRGRSVGGEGDPGVGIGGGFPEGDGVVELCVPALREPAVVAAFLLLVAAAFALAYYDTRDLFPAFVVAGAIGIPIGLVYYALAVCGGPAFEFSFPASPVAAGNVSFLPAGGEGGSPGEGDGGPSVPTIVFGLLLVLGVLASAVLLLASGFREGEEAPPSGDDPDAPDGTDLEAVAVAADRAADRIERTDRAAENEVYRAWSDLTDLLEVPAPATSTPGEFADAAVDAGLDGDDVAELTALFEEVRYGDAPPTADRERRAVAALRRIADEHGDVDGSESD